MSGIWKIIIRNLSYQKLRTTLTLLGIVIGIAAITSMVTIGDALESSVSKQFEKIGTDKIIITPGSPTSFAGAAFSTEKLKERDVKTVKNVNGVDVAFGIISGNAEVKLGKETAYAMVMGVPVDETRKLYSEMKGFEIRKGRDLKSSDKYAMVIGDLVRAKLFEKEIKLRDKLKINGKIFRVVGLFKKTGSPIDDMAIIIPIETAKDIFNNTDEVSMIFVDVKDGVDVDEVAEKIREELKKKRGVEDFKVQTFGDLMQTATKILGIIQYMFVGIAAISLVVGGIGIMNIMLMTVIERTKEIGVMKATGATNKIILYMFLGEAAVVGMLGGIIGFFLGLGGSYIISKYASQMVGIPVNVAFSPELFVGVILFSIAVGMVSGAYPARRASLLDPVDALRYE